MDSITKLLQKKGSLTGEQLGKIIILCNAYIEKHKKEPPIKSEEIQNAIDRLTDKKDIQDYNRRYHLNNFLTEVLERMHWQESEIKRASLAFFREIRELEGGLYLLGKKEPQVMSFSEYEIFKKEKVEAFYTDDTEKDKAKKRELIYFIIDALPVLMKDDLKLCDMIDSYDGQLNSTEKEFLLLLHRDNLVKYKDNRDNPLAENLANEVILENNEDYLAIQALKDSIYAIIEETKGELEIINTCEGTLEKESTYTPTEAEFISVLSQYVEYLRKCEMLTTETISGLVERYSDVLERVKEKLNKEHNNLFKGLSLKACIEKKVAYKDLAEKYSYDFTDEALKDFSIGLRDITKYKDFLSPLFNVLPRTAEELKSLQILDSIENIDLLLIALKNSNTVLEVLASELKIKELLELKIDTGAYFKGFIVILERIAELLSCINRYNEAQREVLKDLFFNKWERLRTCEYKIADKNTINKARKLLDTDDIKKAKTDFYMLLIRGGNDSKTV